MDLSNHILQKLKDSNERFYACDNISNFVSEDDKDFLVDELEQKFEEVLDILLIDWRNDPNSQETPRRLAKQYYYELFAGRYDPPPAVTAFPNTDNDAYDGMIVVRADINSVCSHHHQSVVGVAFIGIIPEGKVLGLSKYIRIAQWAARRGTLQEALCVSIRKYIQDAACTKNVAVYIQATHGCISCRGVMQQNSLTQTCSLGGLFKTESGVKEEFFQHINFNLITPIN